MADIFEQIRSILADLLEVTSDEIKPNSKLQTLGADDLDAVEIVLAFEHEFGLILQDDEAEKLMTGTVQQMADYVAKRTKAQR